MVPEKETPNQPEPPQSRRQKIQWESDDHGICVLRPEIELLDARDQLAFKLRRTQFARENFAIDDLARRSDLQSDHDLSLQRRVFSQYAVIQGVQSALIAIEHDFDLFERPRRFTAPASLQRSAATTATASTADRTVDLRRRTAGQTAAHGTVAQLRNLNAAAAARGVRRNDRARAGTHRGTLRARPDAGPGARTQSGTRLQILVELCRDRVVTQIGQLVFECEQTGARCFLPGHLGTLRRVRRHFLFDFFRLRLLVRDRLGGFNRFIGRLQRDRRRGRRRLAILQYEFREPRRNFLDRVAICLRYRQPWPDQAQENEADND